MSEALIGTSGWVYDSWKERFYPKDLPQRRDLEFYSHEFPTVEINSSYYRLPTDAACTSWFNQVPTDFVFSLKASRFLTHMKKLKDPADPWARIMEPARNLKGKLGPVLLQFPALWNKDLARLSEFLDMASSEKEQLPRLVFEFRNDSWHTKNVLRLLEKHDAAWCIADSHKFERFDDITTDFAYFRFHGRADKNPRYSLAELRKQATLMKKLLKQGIDLFVYFNNDAMGYAIDNALTLRELMD
ncbi:MAG TPA: DUF72 domain-containing protein [Planktothrix sp.]|jgi:uncharacterized protein YecE (DUF72 family)